MPLSDRPFGPFSGAATVAGQTAVNVQATTVPGPLPGKQVITATTETVILNPQNAAQPLLCVVPNGKNIEQKVFDLFASGYITITTAGTITLKLYNGTSLTLGSDTLLGSSGAVTHLVGTSPFFVKTRLIFDSVSNTLVGDIEFYISRTKVASVTLSNFPTVPSNSNVAGAAILNLMLTITSSAAAGGTPTTINVNAFSAG